MFAPWHIFKGFPSRLQHEGTAEPSVNPFSVSTCREPSTGQQELLCFQRGCAALDRDPKAQGTASEPQEGVSRGNSFPLHL